MGRAIFLGLAPPHPFISFAGEDSYERNINKFIAIISVKIAKSCTF